MNNKKEERELLQWAKRAIHGLDQSRIFVGILDDQPLSAARVKFTLQLGHALLNGKPIVLTVPNGTELPAKLRAIADRVVYYTPGDPESLTHALTPVLRDLGATTQ